MLNHLRLFYIYILPFMVMILIGSIPTINMGKRTVAIGEKFQTILFENLLVPLLRDSDVFQIQQWFYQASFLKKWLLHALISLNINIFLLPLLFGLATLVIKFSSWYTKTDYGTLRQQFKK